MRLVCCFEAGGRIVVDIKKLYRGINSDRYVQKVVTWVKLERLGFLGVGGEVSKEDKCW